MNQSHTHTILRSSKKEKKEIFHFRIPQISHEFRTIKELSRIGKNLRFYRQHEEMTSNEVEIERNDVELKHLGFVRVIALRTLVYVSHLYEYAKQNSGSLKGAVGTVEIAVTTVVGPVYEKFKGVPDVVLTFVDQKVDVAACKFDEHAPPLAKQVVGKAQTVVQKASEVTQDLVRETREGGAPAAINYARSTYKQPVLNQLAKAWYGANKIPPFHAVGQVALPTGAYFSEKYNKLVSDMTGKGYAMFGYAPLIPIEDLTKAYKQIEGTDGGNVMSSEETVVA